LQRNAAKDIAQEAHLWTRTCRTLGCVVLVVLTVWLGLAVLALHVVGSRCRLSTPAVRRAQTRCEERTNQNAAAPPCWSPLHYSRRWRLAGQSGRRSPAWPSGRPHLGALPPDPAFGGRRRWSRPRAFHHLTSTGSAAYDSHPPAWPCRSA
jgi:hypothetical protein